MDLNDFDLSKTLKFSPESGEITLGEKRMLIFSQNAFRLLRQLMFEQLGESLARSLLIKFGYKHGEEDYDALQSIFCPQSEEDGLALGPLMHSWSGIVRVEPTLMELDRAKGHFHFKGLWLNSYEAQIHLEQFGKSAKPVCHTLCGYGSGWCSAFFGKELLEVETKCVACGDPYCEWEIRPVDEWGREARHWLDPLRDTSQSIHKELESSRQKILDLNVGLEKEVVHRTEENKHLVRVLCHDLAGPVEVIKNSLQDITSSDADQRFLPLRSAADTLHETLRHVREMQMAQSGKLALQLQRISTNALVRPLPIIWRAKMRNKRLSFDLDFSQLDPQILVDPKVMSRHILGNLIDNAIKFSPSGGKIAIRVSEAGGKVHLSIRDEGAGIAPERQQSLFSSVTPTTSEGTAGESGSGFGLPIVKKYLELHGAGMQIISNPAEGRGTEVLLSFEKSNADGRLLDD